MLPPEFDVSVFFTDTVKQMCGDKSTTHVRRTVNYSVYVYETPCSWQASHTESFSLFSWVEVEVCSLREVAFSSNANQIFCHWRLGVGVVEEIMGKEACGLGVFMRLMPVYF